MKILTIISEDFPIHFFTSYAPQAHQFCLLTIPWQRAATCHRLRVNSVITWERCHFALRKREMLFPKYRYMQQKTANDENNVSKWISLKICIYSFSNFIKKWNSKFTFSHIKLGNLSWEPITLHIWKSDLVTHFQV